MRRTPHTRTLVILAISSLIVVVSLESARWVRPGPRREEKTAAIDLMRRSAQAIKEEKLRMGIPIDRRADTHDTGLIGVEYSDITTTVGSLVAKRTSTHPAFAAVVVDMLDRAGVRRGDAVAVAFSGSFPALNIAVLSAVRALDLHPVIISSVGSSTYGANQPEMTWLDMEKALAGAGLLPYRSIAASLGGIAGGRGGLDGTGIEAGLGAIRRNGIPLIEEGGDATLTADVRDRMALYDQALGGRRPAAFINVGGSLTSVGDGLEGHRIPTGLLKKVPAVRRPERGVIFRMGERGVPVIHLLEIKSIAARYGIPVDPSPLPTGRHRFRADPMVPAFLCLILIYLVAERVRHERRLRRIPIRIHVNGTRGKSDVTRRIAAALRSSGIRTVAKTTGTVPRLILPDGSEEAIPRRSPANILEQIGIVKRADRLNAQAIVVECMALDPDLQFISEAAMIRSTVGVITNVRPDHFEVMGGCLDDVAEALSRSVPAGGVVVTGDRRYYPLFSEVASRRGSRAVLAEDSDPAGDASPREFHVFRENIGIARSVCLLLGLDPAVVDPCPDDAVVPKEGAGIFRIPVGDTTVHLLDAFSANDVESTRILQERALERNACPRPWIALFSHRADRPLRMKSFADDLLAVYPYDLVAVTGEGRSLAVRYLRGKAPGKEVVVLSNRSPHGLLEELLRNTAGKECTIVGMGNEKGTGGSLSRLFRERGARCP